MNAEQVRELLVNVLSAITQHDCAYAATLIQHGLARLNAARDSAPMLQREPTYEDGGDILFATSKRGRS